MATTEQRPAAGVAVQIPRNTLALLMVAQVVVVVPYLTQLSIWIIGVCFVCGCWRTLVYQGRWDYPHRAVKALLVVASVVGVVVSGVGVYSLESAASLLILAFALKLIEMKSRRDAYVVIFLSYFVVATQFLFNWSMASAAYEFFAIIVVTAAMVGLNQWHTRVRPLASLRLSAALVAQALPLTVVLFLLFPRVAPLWSVPLPSSASTGLSDRVTPGDVARLTRSDELAFRVVFDGPVPPPQGLYWRGLVYSEFDAGTWSLGRPLPAVAPPPLDGERPAGAGPSVDYEVLLEPTSRKWLFALDTAVPQSQNIERTADYRLEKTDPVLSVFRYRVRSFPSFVRDAVLPDRVEARELAIDGDDNPRLRDFARTLYARSGSPRAFVDALLGYIRREPFVYTLNPPTLPRQGGLDAFWFDTRRGFCSHYAAAAVFMLRSASIPARVVGGYQGGEINSITNHLVVRQYDAHAWVEAWYDGGWQRLDPTAAVAPARIEQGLGAALSATDRATLSLFSNARLRDDGLVAGVLRWTDSLEHRWNLWVIGYDDRLQSGVLRRLLGDLTPVRIGSALLLAGGATMALVAVGLFWRRRPSSRHPVERLFLRFSRGLSGGGLARQPEESPAAFVRRAAAERGIDDRRVDELVSLLDRLLYNPDAHAGARELRQLRASLRWLQLRLALRQRLAGT